MARPFSFIFAQVRKDLNFALTTIKYKTIIVFFYQSVYYDHKILLLYINVHIFTCLWYCIITVMCICMHDIMYTVCTEYFAVMHMHIVPELHN